MVKKKNNSFVEIKTKNEQLNDDLINPLKKYEYTAIENKNKKSYFIYFLYITIIIILLIIFVNVINNFSKERQKNIQNDKTDNNSQINSSVSTTTTSTVAVEEKTLLCYKDETADGLYFVNKYEGHFENNQLKNDINFIKFSILESSAENTYSQLVEMFDMMDLFANDSQYEIKTNKTTNDYSAEVKITYSEKNKAESEFFYNESYEEVLSKIIEMGYTCN